MSRTDWNIIWRVEVPINWIQSWGPWGDPSQAPTGQKDRSRHPQWPPPPWSCIRSLRPPGQPAPPCSHQWGWGGQHWHHWVPECDVPLPGIPGTGNFKFCWWYRNRYRKKLVPEKSLGTGIGKIWYWKIVLISVLEIFGTWKKYQYRLKFWVLSLSGGRG